MLFVRTFDVILELAPIVGELFGHLVNPAWHVATDCGHEGHALTDIVDPIASMPHRAAEQRDELASIHRGALLRLEATHYHTAMRERCCCMQQN